jgi:hypothetical protein
MRSNFHTILEILLTTHIHYFRTKKSVLFEDNDDEDDDEEQMDEDEPEVDTKDKYHRAFSDENAKWLKKKGDEVRIACILRGDSIGDSI